MQEPVPDGNFHLQGDPIPNQPIHFQSFAPLRSSSVGSELPEKWDLQDNTHGFLSVSIFLSEMSRSAIQCCKATPVSTCKASLLPMSDTTSPCDSWFWCKLAFSVVASQLNLKIWQPLRCPQKIHRAAVWQSSLKPAQGSDRSQVPDPRELE